MMSEFRQRLLKWCRIAVGGPWGVVAWLVSGFSAAAVVIWGIKTVAIPLLMLKTASWGIWGFGVVKESRARDKSPKV